MNNVVLSCRPLLGLAASLALAASGSAQPTPALERVATEKPVIAKIGKFKQATLSVSADGRRFAYGRKQKPGYVVVVDGKVEATHKNLGPIVWWAPNAGSVLKAYAQWGFDQLPGVKPMIFSGDSQHLAYGAKDEDSWFIVRDGQKEKPFKYVGGPVLSRDGQHLAYAAQVSDGWCVVVDGIEGTTFDKVGPPVFSPDGKRFAHAARTKKKEEMMVVDGVEGQAYDSLDAPPIFSISLGLFTRAAFRKIVPAFPVFSADGRLAYAAKRGKRWHAVVEGQESEAFEKLGALVFSPDGKRLAFAGRKDDSWVMILDGQAIGSHEAVGSAVFSPDGSRVAYLAKTGKRWVMVVDGAEQQAHKDLGSPVFSPDGTHLAYTVKTGKKWAVVIDGTVQKEYKAVGEPVFSPDGSRVAYSAARKKGRWMVVVDGVEGKEYSGLVKGASIVFDDPAHIHYLVVSEEQILLVEEELRPA